jgi:hypothetical protein
MDASCGIPDVIASSRPAAMARPMPANDMALALTPRRARKAAAAWEARQRRAAIGRLSEDSVTKALYSRAASRRG